MEEQTPFVEVADPKPGQFTGLPVGTLAPEFTLPDLEGRLRSFSEFKGTRLVLIFMDPRCGFCASLADALAARLDELGSMSPTVLIISSSDADLNRAWFKQHRLSTTVLLQVRTEVALRYSIQGFPMGYLIDHGRIASELAVGGPAVLDLLTQAPMAVPSLNTRPLAESKIKRDGLDVGTLAPDFKLPRVDGNGELSLSQFRDKTVLLVFSSPSCGPCNQLAPLLEVAAKRRPDIQVLMISRGEVEENARKIAEFGLTFPVVLQKQWEISRAYAMFATPIGYLIDGDGVIKEPVAVGADQILGLLAQ